MNTIADRIKYALDRKGMKQADLVSLTGIGKSSISTYLSGEYEPKQRNIYKIAKALDVNEAWLMGEDVQMERVSWDEFVASITEHNKKISDAMDMLGSGVFPAGREDHPYLVYKAELPSREIEHDEAALLRRIAQMNNAGQVSKMRTLRVLSELVSCFNEDEQEKVLSYAEFIDIERQKRAGICVTHPYQQENK